MPGFSGNHKGAKDTTLLYPIPIAVPQRILYVSIICQGWVANPERKKPAPIIIAEVLRTFEYPILGDNIPDRILPTEKHTTLTV